MDVSQCCNQCADLAAWRQAIVAAVFELRLVRAMVIFELLGRTTRSKKPCCRLVQVWARFL
jgi:hypothetical protein